MWGGGGGGGGERARVCVCICVLDIGGYVTFLMWMYV